MKKEDAKEYKELWMPGFSIETNNSCVAQKFEDGVTCNAKHVVKSFDSGVCSVYCPAPHEATMLVSDITKVLIIKHDFFFGII